VKKTINILALILVFCMTFIFAGCDLFTQNSSRYLNEGVISISYEDGKIITITRREYNNAYSNYGANLVNNGYSNEEAKTKTVDALVNRKIILEEAKNNEAVVAKVQAKKSELLYQTYQALVSNAKDNDEDIKKALKITDADEVKEESASGTVYTPYTKKAEVVFDSSTNSYKIKKVEENDNITRDKTFTTNSQVKQAFLAETKDNNASALKREEYVRYIASLRKTQEVLGTNYSDDKLLDEEISRIYTNLEENEYITKYEEEIQFNDGYSTITVSQVLDKYKTMISISNFKYSNDLDGFNSDMLENFKDVNYYVNQDYFYVAHILIKFNDEEQNEYDSLSNNSNDGNGSVISNGYYKARKEQLYNGLKATVTDIETGEVVATDSVPASQVLQEVKIALSNASSNEAKDEAFRKLMYKYNEDGGIMNADYPYIIGVNDSKMVETFTEASRELNEAGVYGAVSGLVESQYGLHIIYYMGKCTNVFTFDSNNDVTLQDYYEITVTEDDDQELINEFGIGTSKYSDVLKLCNKKLNNLNNKTLFDLVYESLENDDLSEFENINVETLKNEYKIKTITTSL